MCVRGAQLIPETLQPCLGKAEENNSSPSGCCPRAFFMSQKKSNKMMMNSPSHRDRKNEWSGSNQHSDGLDQTRPSPSWCTEPCPAVPHLWKPWSCDLQCSRPLLCSPLLWRKLLQLFAEHNVPLISCQPCRAEQFPAAGSPPSSPPPSLAKQEMLLFQHLEVWSAAWGAWGSHAPLLHGSSSSHAGNLSQ